jgi:hypothetical protein
LWWLSSLVPAFCASIVPRDYLVSKRELDRAVLKRFPLEQGQGLLHLVLSAPQISLLTECSRLGFSCDYRVSSSLGVTIGGRFDFSSDLRYDAAQRAVVLVTPQVERLEWQGRGELMASVRALINLALAAFMKDYPLHRFPPGQPGFAGIELDIAAIAVVSEGVRLTLQPKPRNTGQP